MCWISRRSATFWRTIDRYPRIAPKKNHFESAAAKSRYIPALILIFYYLGFFLRGPKILLVWR
nr:MAG TPA: hypothetical protein [Caudoviricetes sp.]